MNNLFEGFPSPIYGASFKQKEKFEKWAAECDGFRPLYTGLVSNKQYLMGHNSLIDKFPSPIYGASFKRCRKIC